MLAVNITPSLRKAGADDPDTVRACAEKWWAVADSTLEAYGDELLAVADSRVAGVYGINGWTREPSAIRKVHFRLVPAPRWVWLIGQTSPITWARGQTNPVRKVGTALVSALRDRQPALADAKQGWALEVAPDGRSATVRAPAADLAVTALAAGAVELTLHSSP